MLPCMDSGLPSVMYGFPSNPSSTYEYYEWMGAQRSKAPFSMSPFPTPYPCVMNERKSVMYLFLLSPPRSPYIEYVGSQRSKVPFNAFPIPKTTHWSSVAPIWGHLGGWPPYLRQPKGDFHFVVMVAYTNGNQSKDSEHNNEKLNGTSGLYLINT